MAMKNMKAEQPVFAPRANAGTASKGDRPSAKFWINIGYMHDSTDEDGNPAQIFVGLPMGIPVDTQEKRSAGSSELMQAKNAFLDLCNETMDAFKPGEEKLYEASNGLWIQLRRVQERDAPSADNNGFIASLTKLKF